VTTASERNNNYRKDGRLDEITPRDRRQRRAAKRRARKQGTDQYLFSIPVLDAFRGESEVPVEVLVERLVEEARRRAGAALTEHDLMALRNDVRLGLRNIERQARGLAPLAAVLPYTAADAEDGRRRLAATLPAARAMAADPARHGGLQLAPQIADALRADHVRLADIDAVLVYPAPPGQPKGWHGDVRLGRMLPFGNTVGTSVTDPCRTRQEAEAAALHMLAAVVATIGDAAKCDA